MRLATWNVNSLKVRLPHLLDWMQTANPDVVCLQELKLEDHAFPRAELEAAGYHCAFAGQKTYNGVAILSRQPISDVVINNPHFDDPQKRLIAATIEGVRVICAYVVNGQEVGSDKYEYKLKWLAALEHWVKEELAVHSRLALLGDYNIAPADADVHDPKAWADQVLCSAPERAAFQRLLGFGLSDAFRLFDQAEKSYSWWDYRMMAFRRNIGLRIDHILLSPALTERCRSCTIDRAPRKWERPSDHAPVIADIEL